MAIEQNNNSKKIGLLLLLLISAVYSFINTEFELRGIASTIVIGIESLLFLMFVFSNKYKFKVLLSIIMLLIIAAGTYLTTGETIFIVNIMVAIVFTKLRYEKTFKILFFERLFILCLIILFSLVGVLPINESVITKGGSGSTVIGYGLGYNHPNQLAYQFGLLVLVYICYRNAKLKQKDVAYVLLIMAVAFFVTQTRTLILIGALLFLLLEIYILQLKQQKSNLATKIMKLSKWTVPLCALLSLGLPMMMATASGRFKVILYALNGYIGSRFTHSARVLELYPVTPFGGIVKFDLLDKYYNYSVVDNGYLSLLYNFGFVGFVIFIFLYFCATKKLIEKQQYIFIIAIISISVWGIIENILRSFAINFTVVFWAECIYYFEKQRQNVIRVKVQDNTRLD